LYWYLSLYGQSPYRYHGIALAIKPPSPCKPCLIYRSVRREQPLFLVPPWGGVPILGLLCYIPLCAPPYSPEGALDKGVPYIRTTAAPATPGLWSLCRRAACYTPPLWVYKLFYGWLPPSATPAFHPPPYKPTIPSTPVLYGATRSYMGPPSLIYH
jgi:hypothetical protein